MSRYFPNARMTTDMVPKISLPDLKRKDYFSSKIAHYGEKYWAFQDRRLRIAIATMDLDSQSPHMRLWHTLIDQKGTGEFHSNYKFPLVKKLCHFGGFRWFFRCPGCANLARVLYLPFPDAWEFGCRKCCNLSYRSCNESHRSDYFQLSSLLDKHDEYYEKLKRHYYRGRPTKKYRKYQKILKQLALLNTTIYDSNPLTNLARKL